MLRPIKKSLEKRNRVLGYAHFDQDAAAILGVRAKLYNIKYTARFKHPNTARNKSEQLGAKWTQHYEKLTGRKLKIFGPQISSDDKGHYLYTQMWLPSMDLPIARTAFEASVNPFGFAPRNTQGLILHNGFKCSYTERPLTKLYKTRRAAERALKTLSASKALKIVEHNQYCQAFVSFWKLPNVSMQRDSIFTEGPGEQFDFFGAWNSESNEQKIGFKTFENIDEGSGRTMGL